MTFPDQAWDSAVQNWQPGGSFLDTLPTPTHGPADGTLIQLPCINQEWVLLLMGCATQLQNPGIWGDALADSIRDQVLSWVTQLLEMLWSGMDVPCCNVQLRLNSSCVLQYSVDGGTTWTDTSGWSTNFHDCVVAQTINPSPPTTGPGGTAQHACNIAGFLATKIIEVMMQKIVTYVGTTTQQVAFGIDVLSTIGFAFPITYAASLAFRDWYDNITGQILSEVSAASTDPTLWSDVTCAIYNGIATDGRVTASNFATVHTNLGAISYTYPWAIAAIYAFWNDIGLANVQAMQNVGALDEVDCSACTGNWCYYTDFTLSNGGWAPVGSYGSFWTSGVGWQSHAFDATHTAVYISFDMTLAHSITEMQVYLSTNQGATSGQPHYVGVSNNPGVSNVCQNNVPFNILGGFHWESATLTCAGRYAIISLITASAGGGFVTVAGVQLRGTGPNPFGSDNCVVGP